MTDRTRIHLAVTQAVADRLERLKTMTEAESTTEVIRRALACYEELASVFCSGGRIVLHMPGGQPRELSPTWPKRLEP